MKGGEEGRGGGEEGRGGGEEGRRGEVREIFHTIQGERCTPQSPYLLRGRILGHQAQQKSA